MSSIRLKYQSSPAEPLEAFPNRTIVFRPVIDVRVLYEGSSMLYKALVDSGSDFCIFHADVAHYLNISVKNGKKLTFHGTSGISQYAYFHQIQIKIGGRLMDLYCGFSYDMQSLPYGLLGQTGFFDRFHVAFDYRKKRIELIKYFKKT